MDAQDFDTLVSTLTALTPRRRLVRLLVALPLLGGLDTRLGGTAVDAQGRRKRRKKRHHHQVGDGKDNRKGQRQDPHPGKAPRPSPPPAGCVPEAIATTCAGHCATVLNNCQQAVDCGPCACGGCAECTRCNPTTGACDPDAAAVGQRCGSPGQVCQGDSRCACPASACASGECVTLTFTPTSDPQFCFVTANLRAFAPDTAYTVTFAASFNGRQTPIGTRDVTTDSCGNADIGAFSYSNLCAGTRSCFIGAEVGAASSGIVQVACSG